MTSVSQGRFSLPDVDVALSNVTAQVDTSIADTIKAFGAMGGEARRGHLEGAMLNELQETGDIINTINAGEDAVKEAIKKNQIDPTNQRFQSLANATAQGKISQQRATIEAEVILRESIAKAPGFAENFRATAREVLGFDPSSASLRTLFLSGPDANKVAPKTQTEDDMETAEAMANGGIGTVDSNFRLIQQERADGLRENINQSRIQRGEMNIGEVMVEGANRTATRLNQIMLGVVNEVKALGSVEDIETVRAGMLSMGDLMKARLENEMAQSEDYTYTTDQYNQTRARIDEVVEGYIAVAENHDLTKLLSSRADRLADYVAVNATNLAPELAMLAHYPQAVAERYLDMILVAGKDPKLLAEMVAQDPRNAYVADVALEIASVAPALRAMAEGTTAALLQEGGLHPDTTKAVGKGAAIDYVDGKDTFNPEQIFESLEDSKMPFTALDMVAKTPTRSFNLMSPGGKERVAKSFNAGTNQQMRTIETSLRNATAKGLQLQFTNGQFSIVDPQGRSASELIPGAPLNFAAERFEEEYLAGLLPSELGVDQALTYLNETLVPMINDPRWAQEAGYRDGQDWAQKQVNKMNLASLSNELTEPGPVVESMTVEQREEFYTAWDNGDLPGVMGILSKIEASGIASIDQTGIAGVIQRGGQAVDAVTGQVALPQYQGNELVEGVNRETQAVAQFEGLHDPSSADWDGKTVAYGLDLKTNPRAEQILEDHGLTGKSKKEVAQYFLENPEASALVLQQEVTAHKEELISAIPEVADLGPVQQEVMANLAYNLGVTKLTGFTNMVEAIKQGDIKTARRELLFNTNKDGSVSFTKWVDDVGAQRAAALSIAMELGRWPSQEEVELIAGKLREKGAR